MLEAFWGNDGFWKWASRIGSLPLIKVQFISSMSMGEHEEINDVGKLRELERVGSELGKA
jgi:hypothetical protein